MKRTPWWLEGGTESCHGCSHRYAYEAVMRCVGCDRGLCTHCVVIETQTREPWCRECLEERED